MRIGILGLVTLTVVACAQPVIPNDHLGGVTDDPTPKKTSKNKTTPAPTTDTPAPSSSPAPPPAPPVDQPPTLTSVVPDSIAIGSVTDGVDVLLNGTKFPSTVQVSLGADKIPATFVSPEQLKVRISADKLKTTGMLKLSVVAKAGLESNALTFTVANPTATSITTLTPPSVVLGTTDPIVLKVVGSGYTAQSVVRFNGAALPTTFTSATELSANLPGTAIVDAGRISVTVALGTDVMSLPFAFEIKNPSPTASALNPSSVASGAAATVTVTGNGFTKGSSVLAGTQAISTTFVSNTTLRAIVPANLLSASGSVQLSVQNGTPGGGTSGNRALAISATGSSSGGAPASSCAYKCTDYGYAPGQCYADYYCIASGASAGCLGQASCGDQPPADGAGANQGASCAYKCADYGYDPGECYADYYCIASGTYAGCLAESLCGD